MLRRLLVRYAEAVLEPLVEDAVTAREEGVRQPRVGEGGVDHTLVQHGAVVAAVAMQSGSLGE